MTITVEILNEKTLGLLRELEAMSLLRVLRAKNGVKTAQTKSAKKVFAAVSLDTRGFKFNRDEANER